MTSLLVSVSVERRLMHVKCKSIFAHFTAHNAHNTHTDNWLNEPENTTVISIVHLFVGVAYTVKQQVLKCARSICYSVANK